MLDIDAMDERVGALERTSRRLAAADALAQEVVRVLLRRGAVRDRYLLDALDAAAERYVQALAPSAGPPSREDAGAAWSLACPSCGVEPGAMCHDTPGGQPRQNPHPERAARARRWRRASSDRRRGGLRQALRDVADAAVDDWLDTYRRG